MKFKFGYILGIALLLCVAFFVVLQYKDAIDVLKELVEKGGPISYIVYVGLLISVGVFLPLSAMPLIPLAATVMDPLVAASLGLFGWTTGALIAFYIAREYGRKVAEHFTSLDRIDDIIAAIPKRKRFIYILIFRLVLPTDLANYALGLTKSLGFIEYSIATLLAFAWYSFLLAYAGDAVLSGNFMLALKLIAVSLVIFSIGWYVLRRSKVS